MDTTILRALRQLPASLCVFDHQHRNSVSGLRKLYFIQTGRQGLTHDVWSGSILVVDAEQTLFVVTEVVHSVVANSNAQSLIVCSESCIVK